MLGPELGKIAWEKAGIIKAGRPVVSARQLPEGEAAIVAEAEALAAPLGLMGRDIDAWSEHGRLIVQTQDRLLDLPAPALIGEHQYANAGLAAAALLTLEDPRIDEAAIARGVAGATWPGRFQRLSRGPLITLAPGADVWVDGAHNPHAARALARACREAWSADGRPIVLITGMLGRKDATGFFAEFSELGPKIYTTGFHSPNATPAETLADAARVHGLDATAADSVEAAIGLAMAASTTPPHIMICGSLHFIGDVLAMSPDTWPT
jgi:dihydrofolate synthase/folylpolyglutamate synthase